MLGHPVAENPIDQMVDVITNPRIKPFLAAAREHGRPRGGRRSGNLGGVTRAPHPKETTTPDYASIAIRLRLSDRCWPSATLRHE
jgi:hypothetical protein